MAVQYRLYSALANWWPLLSSPNNYAEEAQLFISVIKEYCPSAKEVLELGCGGGNNASYLKNHFQMTLTDLSPDMVAVSKQLNPECRHAVGDMRNISLNKEFDVVFVHDAINYMTTEQDLARAICTSAAHCRLGGMVLMVPDHFKETFQEKTSQGGDASPTRALRYLQWQYDPDPTDSTYISAMTYMLRDESGAISFEHDTHIGGLFPKATWERLFREVGLEPQIVPLSHSQTNNWQAVLGKKG